MAVEPPSTSLYYLLNKALREKNRSSIRPFVKILWLLMHALKKAQPYSDNVFRCGKLDLSGQYVKGQKVTWPAFTSTTTSTALEAFEQGVFQNITDPRTIFNITLTSGRARMISELSMTTGDNENEVLLPPNSRFEVMDVLGPTAAGQLINQLREIASIDPILQF
eukprot:gene42501-biopygen34138